MLTSLFRNCLNSCLPISESEESEYESANEQVGIFFIIWRNTRSENFAILESVWKKIIFIFENFGKSGITTANSANILLVACVSSLIY